MKPTPDDQFVAQLPKSTLARIRREVEVATELKRLHRENGKLRQVAHAAVQSLQAATKRLEDVLSAMPAQATKHAGNLGRPPGISNRHRHDPTDAEKREMVKLYREGKMLITEIGRKLQVSPGVVTRYAKLAGLRRGPGGRHGVGRVLARNTKGTGARKHRSPSQPPAAVSSSASAPAEQKPG